MELHVSLKVNVLTYLQDLSFSLSLISSSPNCSYTVDLDFSLLTQEKISESL